MSRRPLLIVEEYLQSSKAEIRQKAARALSVLNDEDGVGRLVDVALDDPDEKVQQEAVKLLEGLEEETRATARSRLFSVLHGASERDAGFTERHYRANLLLSGLNPEPETSEPAVEELGQRLLLANGMRDYLNRRPKASDRKRSVWSGVFGGAVGAALLISAALALDPSIPEQVFLAVFAVALLLGALMSLAIALGASAMGSYEDRLAGWIVETVGAASDSLFGVTSVTLVTLLAWPQVTDVSVLRIAILGLGAIATGSLFIGLIRYGTALGYRAWAATEKSGPRVKKFFLKFLYKSVSAATGWTFGGSVLTTLLVLLAWLPPTQANDDTLTLLSGIWFTLLPMGLGVALALAEVESRSAKIPERRSRNKRIASALVIIAFLAVHARIFRESANSSEGSLTDVDSIWLKDSLPFSQGFEIKYTQRVRVAIAPRSADDVGRIALSIWRGSDQIGHDVVDPLDLEVELKPGFYRAEAQPIDTSVASAGPGTRGLDQRFGKTPRRDYFTTARRLVHRVTNRSAYQLRRFELSVTFNSDPGFVFKTRVRASLSSLDIEEALRLYSDLTPKVLESQEVAETLELLCLFGSLHRLRERLDAIEYVTERDRELLQICESTAPLSSDTSYGLGLAYLATGRFDDALDELEAHRETTGVDAQERGKTDQWIDILLDETKTDFYLVLSQVEDELNVLVELLRKSKL